MVHTYTSSNFNHSDTNNSSLKKNENFYENINCCHKNKMIKSDSSFSLKKSKENSNEDISDIEKYKTGCGEKNSYSSEDYEYLSKEIEKDENKKKNSNIKIVLDDSKPSRIQYDTYLKSNFKNQPIKKDSVNSTVAESFEWNESSKVQRKNSRNETLSQLNTVAASNTNSTVSNENIDFERTSNEKHVSQNKNHVKEYSFESKKKKKASVNSYAEEENYKNVENKNYHREDLSQKTNHENSLKGSSLQRRLRKGYLNDENRRRSRHQSSVEKNKEKTKEKPNNINPRRNSIKGSSSDEDDEELKTYKKLKITKVTPDMIGRTGGVYIPPYKLERIRPSITDNRSVEYQRQSWEALRKSINGLVNRVNTSNIKCIVLEMFKENLIRGRGLLARAILRAQLASPGFTHIYACLLSIINSKFSEIGELVIKRLLLQFRRAYRRNDKIVCSACVSFLAHLVNQKVIHELLALQLAALFLEELTNDSVELCVKFMKEVGQVLYEICPQGFNAILERFRGVLHEGLTDERVQYSIEIFFDIYKKKFSDYPGVIPELDLVEEENQITHEIDLLDPNINGQELLNIFKAEDPEVFLQNEALWANLSKDILGGDDEDNVEDDNKSTDSTCDDSELEDTEIPDCSQTQIKDMTEQEIINLRKTIYLTIMSSASYEECVHKLLKINIKKGCEIEVCTMLIDCCAMERTFQKFFALQAERLCKLNILYQELFSESLKRQYDTIHRLETNKLRNTAKFFAHLFYMNSIPWSLLELFVLTENTTTSASRIFIKIIFQELTQHMGIHKLNDKLQDSALQPYTNGIFPRDNPHNMRFSINFFTAIGLGLLTSELRKELIESQRDTFSSSDSSEADSSSNSSDYSDTEDETESGSS